MKRQLNITPNGWHYECYKDSKDYYLKQNNSAPISDWIAHFKEPFTSMGGNVKDNIFLCAEAGTVYHETNRTPKQLASENSDLRILLGRFIAQFAVGNLDGDNTVKADLLGQAYKLIEDHSND